MKITKSELRQRCIDNETAIATLETLLKEHGITRKQETKLKQLDQSIFDGLDSDYMFAAIDGCTGRAYAYEQKPHIPVGKDYWRVHDGMQHPVDYGYDTTNWQNSLIERGKVELTGSDLCRYIKSRKHWVLAVVSDENDATAEFHQRAIVVTGITSDGRFKCGDMTWRYAVPIDHKGEPLAQSDVGL